MWHFHDPVAVAAALAVIWVILVHSDLLDRSSLLWRTLIVPARIIGQTRRNRPSKPG